MNTPKKKVLDHWGKETPEQYQVHIMLGFCSKCKEKIGPKIPDRDFHQDNEVEIIAEWYELFNSDGDLIDMSGTEFEGVCHAI